MPMLIALAFFVPGTETAFAESLQTNTAWNYTTQGYVAMDPSVFRFDGVTSGEFQTPTFLSLGQFAVGPRTPEQPIVFDNTPFAIQVRLPDGDRLENRNGVTVQVVQSLVIRGVLQGTIQDARQSNAVAIVESISRDLLEPGTDLPGISASDLSSNLARIEAEFPFPLEAITVDPFQAIVPISSNQGITTIQARIVPEPGSWLIMGVLSLVLVGITRHDAKRCRDRERHRFALAPQAH